MKLSSFGFTSPPLEELVAGCMPGLQLPRSEYFHFLYQFGGFC